MFKKILLLFFFIILICSGVSAFLISPPVLNVKYESGVKNTYEVFVINNEDKSMELTTIVDYKCFNNLFNVNLNTDKLIFIEGEYKNGFNFDLSLPSNLPVGKYEIRVGAEERLSSGMLGLKVANMVRVIIDNGGDYVSCDGVSSNVTSSESNVDSGFGETGDNTGGFSDSGSVNFEITNVEINDVVSGEKAELKIFVKNKGDAVNVNGVIDVIRNGLKVGTLKTNSDYLGKDSNIVLTSYINTVNLDPSEYLLKINIFGGSESRSNDAKFRVLCSGGKVIGGYSLELFILVLILILILLVLYLMFRYIHKEKKTEEWDEDIFYQ